MSLPETEALSSGVHLGERYEIGSVLGRGATGIVYSASRLNGEGDVALKVIHPQLVADAQVRARFKREAMILRRLKGEHVCPVIDFEELADPGGGPPLLCLALEKISGPTLESIQKTEGPLDFKRSTQIMIEICDALSAAHAEGVVHRDLKPANVILAGGKRVVVVDFGLSKVVGASSGTTGITAHGMIFGTPTFMSPEQARGEELDGRSDIYSAGIILYELLTETVPFSSKSPISILTMHSETMPATPRERAPGRKIPLELEAVCLKAIAKKRDERFQSATEFADALRRSLSGITPLPAPKDKDPVERTMPAIPRPSESTAPRKMPDSRRSVPPSSSKPAPFPRAWIVVYVLSVVVSVAVGVAVAYAK